MKIRVLTVIMLALLSVALKGQQKGGWFGISEVASGIYRIDDHGAVNVYLVIGKDSALVIDTGMGTADLASQIRKLTDRPLIVVNTHGHPDHTGANYQFKKVWIHPLEMKDALASNDPEKRKQAAQAMLHGAQPADNEIFKGVPQHTLLLPVREGYVFRLGGRNIKVIETPGHTPGEIVLLDIEDKLLFAGDNDNTLVWLFLPSCRPLHEYLSTLEKLQGMRNEFGTILPGHGIPRKAAFIDDQVKCVKGILDRSLEAKPYQSFAGNAMISAYGEASVAFDPKNL